MDKASLKPVVYKRLEGCRRETKEENKRVLELNERL